MPRFLEGDTDSTPEGYATLANVFSLLVRNTPVAALERFRPEHLDPEDAARGAVPAEVGSHELVYAATWEVLDRVSAPALLGPGGAVQKWTTQFIEPRSSRHRWELCNEHLNLSDGRIGTGCDSQGNWIPEEEVRRTWGDLAGRSVLLPARQVAEALAALGLPEPREGASKPSAERDRRPGPRDEVRTILADLYPAGTTPPPWGMVHTAVIAKLGRDVSRKTIQRAARELGW